MKYGARNAIVAKVKSINSDEIISLIKFEVVKVKEMASVITTESIKHLNLKVGDEVQLVTRPFTFCL